jgi:lipopolysaccharide biosynthesis regulator YciM
LKQNRLSEAKHDFSRAIDIDSNKFSGYIGLGDCCRASHDYRNAIKNYSIVIGQEEHLMEIIGLKRVVCFIEMKDFQAAMADVDKVDIHLPDIKYQPEELRGAVLQRPDCQVE